VTTALKECELKVNTSAAASSPSSPEPGLPTGPAAILGIFGKNTFWLWLDLGALRIGSLLAGFFLIRYLGPNDFGLYSTAIAVGFVVNAVSDLGLTRYTARAISANASEGPPILALSLLTTAGFAFLEVSGLIVALLGGHREASAICAGLIINNLEGTAILCSAMLTAKLRSRQILPGSITSTLVLIGLSALVIVFHLSVVTFLVLGIFRSLSVLCVRLWQLRDVLGAMSFNLIGQFRRLAHSAWPFFCYNMTQVTYTRLSIVCFSLVAPQSLVGIFSAAFVLSDVFPQWSYAMSGALLPLWTRLFETGRNGELLELRESLMDLIILLCVPAAVAISVFAPEICALLGQRFASSALVLRLLAYRVFFSVVDGFLGHGFLIAINRVRDRQRAQARSLVLLVALTLVLGRLWGPTGAACALFMADAVLILQYLSILSKMGLRVSSHILLPSLFAGGAMAAVALGLKTDQAVAARLIFGFLAYGVLLIVISRSRLLGAGRTLRHCLSGGV
jgi:O-antigen/teichoic acid export membrane protein